MTKYSNKVGLILIFLSVIYSLYSVETFKLFYEDSLLVASYAYNYVSEGQLYDIVNRGPGMALAHGRIHDIIYGNVMVFFENYLYAHRYLSWVISIVTLFVFYKICLRIGYSKVISTFSTLFLSITEHFILSAHIGRTDILAFLFVLTVIYLATFFDKYKLSMLVAGMLSSLAIDIHLSTQYVLLMIMMYELTLKGTSNMFILFFKYRLFILGYLLGLFVVVFNNIHHIEQIKEAYFLLDSAALSVSVTDRLSWLFTFWINYTAYRFIFYPVILLIVIFLYLFKKMNKSEKVSFYIFIGGYIGFLLMGRMNHHYLILFMPFLYPILIQQTVKNNILIALFTIIAATSFIGIQAYSIYKDGSSSIKDYREKVKSAIKIDSSIVVIAPGDLWVVYKKNTFHGYLTESDIFEIKENHKVLFISNEVHAKFLDNGTILGSNTGSHRFNRGFLDGFKSVSEITDKHYGGFGITKNNTITFYVNY